MIPLRDENPLRNRRPIVNVALIAANVLVFLYQVSLGPTGDAAFIADFATLPAEITSGANLPGSTAISPYLTMLTSMFLHGGWAHLIGNCWFLWIFGDNIEDELGHFVYLAFYLVCGLVADLAHVLLNADSVVPVLGASGAISGVLGGYILLHPKIRVRTLLTLGFYWRILDVPAWTFLALWFVLQLLGLFGPAAGVAFAAHVGGFVAGVVLIALLTSGRAGVAELPRYARRRQTRW
jgi:membrane associated rhomboid family serine protease